MKVQIRNYQSLRKGDLEFPSGVTVIVGENNSGKTAVFRAVMAAIFNKSGDRFIRIGTNHVAIRIQLEDEQGNPHEIVWKKVRSESGNITSVYIIDKKQFTKLGRGQLQEVRDLTRIGEIDILKQKERINFWSQDEMPFLMGKTPSQLFEFLSLSSEEDSLSTVLRDMKSDMKDISGEIKTTQGGIDVLNSQVTTENDYITSKNGYLPIYKRILEIDGQVSELTSLTDAVGRSLVFRDRALS